jgi:hypothetical protein
LMRMAALPEVGLGAMRSSADEHNDANRHE